MGTKIGTFCDTAKVLTNFLPFFFVKSQNCRIFAQNQSLQYGKE